MPGKEVQRSELDLQRDREVLSTPYLVEPLYRCALSVTVRGFVPHAELDVDVDGVVTTVAAGFPNPHGETVLLPDALEDGQVVRVRQRTPSSQSDWAVGVRVRDHTVDYPSGPPRPEINPAPVYACGSRTGVSNLLPGGNVWIEADGVEVGSVKGCSAHQGVNVNPDYSFDEVVRARYELCDDESAPSVAHVAGDAPNPLPMPSVDDAYEGGEQLRISNIANGARVTVYRNGSTMGTWRCWGYALLVGVGTPLVAGETFEAEQRMCGSDPASPTGGGTVQPCSSLPAPGVQAVQLGDEQIYLTSFVSDAVVEVYLNLDMVGAGSGPIVSLSRAVAHGDIVRVGQVLGSCIGESILEVEPMCVAPKVGADPSHHNVFPVGHQKYNSGANRGSVYYPAADDGEDARFNERAGNTGPVPIVFMAHGNHSASDPSYLGYTYLQHHLAAMGIVSVSVDCNALNGPYGGVENIEDRADLILSNVDHFQSLDATPGNTFSGRIDFSRVGLMGHSRGGDAVVTIPPVTPLPGVTVRSVVALAPTNFRSSFGLPTIRPKGYAFMTILPAGDGDVRNNNGAQFYDQAADVPFKSQVYAHRTNHNFYNREWLFDDGLGPPVLSRGEHERILSAYACALYRATLLQHTGMLSYLSNHALPGNVRTDMVHLSFDWQESLTVDDHEENNGIDTNSVNQPTSQTDLSADEFAFHQSAIGGLAPFNASFFGENLGMVAQPDGARGVFRSELRDRLSIADKEIWVRAAEVYSAPLSAQPAAFELGVEDANGTRVWVHANGVGGVPRPFDRRADDMAKYGFDVSKTMLKTLRFPGSCFQEQSEDLEAEAIVAILLRFDAEQNRGPVAFDDLHIVERVW